MMNILRKFSAVKMLALLLMAAVLPAHAAPKTNGLVVTVPNGYAAVTVEDLTVSTTAGPVRWLRVWNGQEWKFNPQWESLSQSWKNLTGSQTADTTLGSGGGATVISSGGGGGESGCWVWVDENWQPSTGTTVIGGPVQSSPMTPVRTTPFNRMMGETGLDYPAPQRVSVDYATLCGGSSGGGSAVRDVEGIRRANELYLGEGGRYAFSNRAVLEKRAVREVPAAPAAVQYASLGRGAITLAPVVNAKGFRWIDKGGDWIDYDTQGQVVAWGDKNDNILWMVRDTDGVLRGVVDANGRVVYSLHYTGELVTEVRDYSNETHAQARVVKYKYDMYNRLTEVTDGRGKLWQYAYDPANRIVELTDPEGRVEKLEYSGDMVKKRTAPDGAVTDYNFDYDDTNKQFASKITYPETTAGRRVEELTHNRVGKIVRATVNGRTDLEVRYDTGARARVETNARGFATRVTNNEFDQVVEVVLPDGARKSRAYSSLHLELMEETDELGFKTRFEYDARGNVIKRIAAAGTAQEQVSEYVRNALGQITKSISKGSSAAVPDAVWQLEYDALGQVKKTTDPEGHVRHYDYDQAGNLVRFTDARGFVKNYKVDADGNLLEAKDALNRIQTYTYDNVGNVIVFTDARAQQVRASYDAMNRHVQTINPVGGTSRIQYNGHGLPISETDEDGRVSLAEFDNFLRVSKQTDGMGNATEFSYNLPDGSTAGTLGALEEPTEIKYPTYTERLRYDQLERPTTSTLLNPNRLGTEGLVSTTGYDKRGQAISETDANGKTSYYTYDALGQLIETKDSLGNTTKAKYDGRGNLIQITDARGHDNKFEVDLNDRIVKEILPLGQVTTYRYDPSGNLIEHVSPNNDKAVFTYDEANRVVEAKRYNAANVLARTTTYAWDAADNTIGWTEVDHLRGETSSAIRTFDNANRKTDEVVTYPDGTKLGYSYAYSPAGNKTQLTWPDGTEIAYRYTAHNELETVSIPGEGTISATSFKWLMPTRMEMPGGVAQERTLDGLLNLEGLRVQAPGKQPVLTLANTFGKVQELKAATRTDLAAATTDKAFTYDAMTQLTEVTTGTAALGTDTERFTLDAVGNRVAHSRVAGAWTYDANNRLTQRGTGANAASYEYDEAGNLTRRVEAGNVVTVYGYDTQNRLIQVSLGNGDVVARYGYDPLDRRMWREQYRERSGAALSPAKRTIYLYSDEGLMAEATQELVVNPDKSVTPVGTPVITTQYGVQPDVEFNTGVMFVKTRASNGQPVFAYYHHDQLGTPIQATNKAGDVVWAASYEVFGRATITTPAATEEKPTIQSYLRLPGQIEDPETGLHYNFRRYYDPSIGRFITQDPIGIEGGTNKYKYAEGDPVNLTDPSGECPMCVGYAVCVAQCMLEDAAVNTITGNCNNFGDSAKDCALSCVLGPLGRLGKWGKRAKEACSYNSFIAETLVHLRPEGAGLAEAESGKTVFKTIDQIRIGDEVLAYSEWKMKGDKPGRDERFSYEKVTDVFASHQSQTLVHITLETGDSLTTTSGHPFRTPDGWRDAILLKKGGKLLVMGIREDGQENIVSIASVQTEQKVIPVFNIEVANAHTFFVGKDGELVHNCKRGSGIDFTKKTKKDTYDANPNCVYCGIPTVKSKKPQSDRTHIDHKESAKNGGTNDPKNAQTTCQTCNLDKGGMSDHEYRSKKGL